MAFSFASGSNPKDSAAKKTDGGAISSKVFADDDEETWKKLVSVTSSDPSASGGDETDSEIRPLLSSLTERLQEDWSYKSSEVYWNEILKRTEANGTSNTALPSYQTVDSGIAAKASGGDTSSLPEAFRSENGTKHLEAITALLGLSKQRAVQVTMGALRSVDTAGETPGGKSAAGKSKTDGSDQTKTANHGNDNFSSLLGTRELLAKTVAYHHKQRSARLSVLAECLRLEQDINCRIQEVIAQTVLDPLDATAEFSPTKRKRGIFKNLLVVACQHDPKPQREALEPANSLVGSYSTIANSNTFAANDASARFSTDLFSELVAQTRRERTQAMEGLLALLYQRLDGGIKQRDFGLLVNAFFVSSSNVSSKDARWYDLSGLICAECMALWKAFEQANAAPAQRGGPSPRKSWTDEHPLLENLGSDAGIGNFQGIAVSLVEAMPKEGAPQQSKAPLSLAILSYGLLLCLASDEKSAASAGHPPIFPGGTLSELLWGNESGPKSLRELGDKLVNFANDEAGAFDGLRDVVSNLTRDALSDSPAMVAQVTLYDWQLFPGERNSPTLMLTDGNMASSDPSSVQYYPSKHIPSEVVEYTSIAREILAACIASFSENLLAIDRTDSCRNIGMLCQLVSVIFRNNEPLCQQFWELWENEINRTDLSSKHPMCRLLDAAYNLSNQYISGYFAGQVSRQEFLEAIAPFLQMLSAICHKPDFAETMLGHLHPTMIRTAIQCCESESSADANALQIKVSVLSSLEGLSKIASFSPSCLAALRGALEPHESLESSLYEGPVLLSSILDHTSDNNVARHVLGIVANLLKGAPRAWAAPMAQQFIDQSTGNGESASSRLVRFVSTKDEALSHSAILVLSELIENMSQVVFDGDSRSVTTGKDILNLSLLQSLGAVLVTSMTSLARTTISTASAETAEIVFRSFVNFLKWIKPIIQLQASPFVKEGTSKIRDTMIQTLATSNALGEVLLYFATAPVSLGLLIKMQETILDQSIAEQVAREDLSDSAKQYGAWYSLSSSYKSQSSGTRLSKTRILEFLASMTPADFDLPGARDRGWIKGSNPNGIAILDASRSAIRLLSEWASNVEDIAKTHLNEIPSEFPLKGDARNVVVHLSPQQLLSTMAPMPPMLCHLDPKMPALWKSLEFSTMDLLLPYLNVELKEVDPDIPTSFVLNLLNACLAHLKLTIPNGELATSTLLRTLVKSDRFASLLKELIERGIQLAGNERNSKHIPEINKGHYLNTFLGLRILSSCVATAPTVAYSILGLDENSGFTRKLVEGALYANKVLDLTGSEGILTTEGSILQMRVASGCLSVLSALWKSMQVLSQGKTSDKVVSALRKEADGQSSAFVLDLRELVSNYASSDTFDERIEISHETEFGRISVRSFITSALEILANAVIYESSKEGENGNSSALDILTHFTKSKRLLESKNFLSSAQNSVELRCKIDRYAGLKEQDALSFLSSFHALSSNLEQSDFYNRENSFDIYSLSQWLTNIGLEGEDFGIRDNLNKESILHHLTTAELHLTESWKKLLEIAVFRVYFSNGCMITGSTLEIVKNLTMETLRGLRDNLYSAASAQTLFSTAFMTREIFSMSSCLGDLLLFQLEIGAFDLLPLDDLLQIARFLDDATQKLHDVACPQTSVESNQSNRLQDYCKHQQTLLSCSLVVCGLIEKLEHSRPDHGIQGDIYLSLCLTNCKFVQAFSRMCNKENICQEMNTTIIRSCASLFTLLVIGYQGDFSSNASYASGLSNAFNEYEVMKLLMQYATLLSAFVGKNLSSLKNSNPSPEDKAILDAIKAVFNLLHAIADTNDPKMIKILYGVELSQLAVRNPLFSLRSHMWSHSDPTQVLPRGYVFRRETVTTSNQQSSVYLGSEDPVYQIWLASMQVIGACVRTSSHYLNSSGRDNLGSGFLDLSIEFLRVFQVPLLACLKSCVNPSKMTRLALREAKVLLAMIAELCKRNVRTSFISSNLELCQEFLDHSKVTIASMSTFLGAMGTSCELFAAIEEYESTDQDRFFDDPKSNPMSQFRLSLLSIGLPMAKQKAMRLSNYASNRLEKVSQEDLQLAKEFPDYLKALSQKRAYESSSEQICRSSVTNEFSLGLALASAKFVCQALSLVLRTHANSKSFYTFSEPDKNINCMGLVEPGIVIGYRPNIGQNMLFNSSGFECLRFGRVLKVDTFSRTWEVEVIRQEGSESDVLDGRREIVQAAQLAGLEDKSTRKPSTCLPAPAPDSMTDFEKLPGYLTTGNYILILRWCHQQTSLIRAGSKSLGKEVEVPSYIQQIAEQASILLGADLVLHGLNGSFLNADKKEMYRLDDQIFELFADRNVLAGNLENEQPSTALLPEGRMKEVLDESVWKGLQSQVRPFVQRAWAVRQESERKRQEKRAKSGGNDFFSSGYRRKGKSPFR